MHSIHNSHAGGKPAVCCTLLSPPCRLGWRTNGAACAILGCTATNAVLLTSYRMYRDLVQQAGTPQSTWRGYSWEAFKGWGTYLSYGVPAAAMICLEW
jgi:hypothetical protein